MSNEYTDWYTDNLIEDATKFAYEKHDGQKRKYTGEDYVTHPIEVAHKVAEHMRKKYDNVPLMAFSVMDYAVMFASAMLHDTVEDTDATFEDIEKKFGKSVCEIVYWLTNVSKPEDGNRKIRKQKDLDHVLQAPIDAICIKMADVICNCKGMVETDRKYSDGQFCKKYISEKIAFMDALNDKFGGKSVQEYGYYYAVFESLFNELKETLNKEMEILNDGL